MPTGLRRAVTALFLALGLFAPMAGRADAPTRPEMLSPEAHARWTAIGRVNVGGYNRRSLCTGTLVAPDRVLTAAHCVFRDGALRAALTDIRFVAGWRQGAHAGLGRVSQVALLPSWESGGGPLSEDVALLTLSDPLAPAPLALAAPRPGTPVRILGYRADRPHALSDSGLCRHGRRVAGGRSTDCAASFGTSGAPVLQAQGDVWQVVGVVGAVGGGLTHFAPWSASLGNRLGKGSP